MGFMTKKMFRVLGMVILFMTVFLIFYVLVAFVGSRIIINKEESIKIIEREYVDVYILTNGVHTDLVFPIQTPWKDWSSDVLFEHTIGQDSAAKFVAFGWGDKGFYLETPNWEDLKFSVAFKAAFGLSKSAIHTTFYKKMNENADCIKIKINPQEYITLVEYVDLSFERNASNQLIPIVTDAQYGKNDAFYEAKGSYSLFFTCNTWVNKGLKSADLKTCLWTPFDTGIFYPYQK
jgi:uncharacterized protein (TIGR02117 family)